jgi:hypothetical protein
MHEKATQAARSVLAQVLRQVELRWISGIEGFALVSQLDESSTAVEA